MPYLAQFVPKIKEKFKVEKTVNVKLVSIVRSSTLYD